MKSYEAMLIADPVVGGRDWDRVVNEIGQTIKKHGGQVVSAEKWGDRRFAYPIRKQTRGVYVLVYFDAPTSAIVKIRAEVQLSEIFIRAAFMTLKCERKQVQPPPEVPAPGVKS